MPKNHLQYSLSLDMDDRNKEHNIVPGKWRQYLVTAIINLSTFMAGLSVGWISPTLPQLRIKETPVGNEPFTEDQISWLSSTMSLGTLIILPFTSIFAEQFGRKMTGYVMAVPALMSWLFILFAENFMHLEIAQITAGFVWGLALFLVPLYVIEISSDNIRGRLGTLTVFGLKLGCTTSYALGAFLSYRNFAIVCMLSPAIFLIGFIFMPETPVYLIRKKRLEEARRSLMWLRNNNRTVVEQELASIESFVNAKERSETTVGLKDLFRDHETIKGLIIGLGLLIGQQANGVPVVLVYTTTIFAMTKSSLTPGASTIIVGLMQVTGVMLSSVSSERVGGRFLILISCLGMGICHCILATFFLLQTQNYEVSSLTWIPVVALSGYALIFGIGLGPASYVVSSEVLRSDISSMIHSISLSALMITNFTTAKLFPTFSHLIGVHGCFYFFAFVSLCIFGFTYYIVPETKGRSIESILEELRGPSKNFKRSKDNEYSLRF